MLSSSRGQGNFRGPKASRPRPRTSKCVLEDVLEAKDVLEDSTSVFYCQRWSPRGRPRPRGHILKSLALASKVKSLASKPQVLENCPVLGSRTALFFEWLKSCRLPEKKFWRPFFWSTLAFVFLVLGLERSCPWPRECLSSEGLSLASDFVCVLGLKPCVLDSTSVYCTHCL